MRRRTRVGCNMQAAAMAPTGAVLHTNMKVIIVRQVTAVSAVVSNIK